MFNSSIHIKLLLCSKIFIQDIISCVLWGMDLSQIWKIIYLFIWYFFNLSIFLNFKYIIIILQE